MSGRRRVIVVHPSDEMYGADRVLLESLRTAPDDVDLEVWLPTDVDYPQHELSAELARRGIAVRRMPLPVLRRAYLRPRRLPGLALRAVVAGARLLWRRPQLVYLNTAACAALAPFGRLAGARVVLHLHEYIDGRARVVLPFVAAAHRIIAVSHAVTVPLSPRARRRTRVVHNGFDLPAPSPLPGFADGIRLIVASRWNTWKGHRTLLAAWARVDRCDLRLTVLGAPPLSGNSVDVARLAGATPGNDRIVIAGQTVDVRAHLDTAHAVVVPSERPDPLPTIAIEALAAGRAIIGSDSGGLVEIVGADGILVPTGDVAAWAAALSGIDEARLRLAASGSRARFEAEFSRETFDDHIRGILWTEGRA
ncbi:glycosyltransferase family 4 protein [Galbitalea sp. SE-J8]|uniref:glycosyltransferase family 4 protein n=1 Tax=Galbitalea sp. SE-J8 TaxID=3054952 RepID=UPI00259C7604|nr:glycosyltransferase family 4 protein [Galbitalea sp. SE-J8]MDM4761506.1 glycosyltransferase family 4 protein [Galbitalea sp. SE-J8]